ncbi:hypothetical protein ACFLXD_06050 [Chloroflexota bacterium]
MTTVLTYTRESSIGTQARSIRMSLQLTQQELADIVGVSKEDVDLLEHNLPIPLYFKNKILKKLHEAKSAKESQLRFTL